MLSSISKQMNKKLELYLKRNILKNNLIEQSGEFNVLG